MLYEIFQLFSHFYAENANASLVPSTFRDCADHFDYPHDLKYNSCVERIKEGDTPCELLKELRKAKEFRTYFLAILPIILASIALLINIVHFALEVVAFRKANSSLRKRYVFLMSRTLSSIMALLLLYVVIIVWKAQGFLYSSVMIFILIGCLDFMSITGTYVVLTLLLYTAIMHPIFYKTSLRLRHCITLVMVIWTVSTAVSICVGMWGGTLFYPDSAPVKCPFSTCQRPLSIVLLVLLCVCYSTVLVLYLFLLLRMNRMSRMDSIRASSDSRLSSVTAMHRLGMNMGTFAIGSIPIVIVLIVAISNLQNLSSLGEGEKSPCKTFLNSQLFVQVEVLGSAAAVIWLLAMILDPIINFVSDPKLIRILRNLIESTCRCSSIRNRTLEETPTDSR